MSDGSSVEVFETESLNKKGTIKSKGVNWIVRFSPDGKHLFCGTRRISVWDVEAFKHVYDFEAGSGSYVQLLAVSRDGRFFTGLSRLSNERMRILVNPFGDSKLLAEIEERNANTIPRVYCRFPNQSVGFDAVSFSKDGKYVYAGKTGLAVFDVKGKRAIQKLDRFKEGYVKSLACTSDGKNLLVGTYSGAILIFDVGPDGKLSQSGKFVSHTSAVLTMAVGPEDRTIVSGSRKRARIWDLKTKRELISLDFEREIQSCRVIPNGKAAIVTDGKKVVVVKLDNVKIWKEFDDVVGTALGPAALSEDGRNLATRTTSGVNLVDTKTGIQFGQFKTKNTIYGLLFLPDGDHLLVGTRSKIEIWDVKSQELVDEIQCCGAYSSVKNMASNLDGSLISALPSGESQLIILNNPLGRSEPVD